MIQDYRYYHHNQSTLETDERVICEQKATLARETLISMFRGHLREGDLLKKDEASLRKLLCRWARDQRPVHLGGRTSKDTPEACAGWLRSFSSSSVDDEETQNVWPYIQKIRYVQ